MSNADEGFSLTELIITMSLMLIVFGIVTGGLAQLSERQKQIWNRTEMHSGVRGATELMQQEVGQAGRVSLPNPVTTGGAAVIGTTTVAVSSTAGMFVGEQVVFDAGDNEETVALTAVSTGANTVTATFKRNHAAGVAVASYGGFSQGVVPTSVANGSTATVLKMFGDINADGNMVYVEYTCDTTAGFLYRNVMAWNAATKPAVTPSQILLSNITANPGGTPCFTYQTNLVGTTPYITDVAITLTVQTQQVDPITKRRQLETKALLNVSPRNVFNVYELASVGLTNRVQPTPPSVTNLMR